MQTAVKDSVEQGKIRLLIVDDHPVFREGLVYSLQPHLNVEVIGEAEDVPSARMLLSKLRPDLAILDISLKKGSGIDLIRDIRALLPDLPILVFSMHDEMLYAMRCLTAGANGYLMKEAPTAKVVQAIKEILGGSVYASEFVKQQMLSDVHSRGKTSSQDPVARLSNRELEIFHLIGQAYSTKQIAKKMGISEKTVEIHRMHIKSKLMAGSFIEVVRLAVQWVEQKS